VDLVRTYYWLSYTFQFYPHPEAILDESLGTVFALPSTLFWYVDHENGYLRPPIQQIHLHHLHLTSCMRQAFNKRDHVFAIRGMYKHVGGKQELTVDYGKPIGRVYADAAFAVIADTHRLELLYDSRNTSRLNPGFEDLPTWVPDWSRFKDPVQSQMVMKEMYRADNDRLVKLAESPCGAEDKSILSIHGIICSRIVCNSAELKDGLEQLLWEITLWDERCAASSAQRIASQSALAATLALGRHSGPLHPSIRIKARHLGDEEALGYFREIGRPVELMIKEERYARTRDPLLAADIAYMKSLVDSEGCRRYAYDVRTACNRRRLFMTQYGDVGLGPLNVREGDIVVILYGAPWPIVLRELPGNHEQNHFELVSMCYVHGLMDGEAVGIVEEAGIDDVVFHIH
jgi:hypothetical protein